MAGLSVEEQGLIEKVDAWVAAHREEFVADLLDWVSIPSVSESSLAAPGAPFGPEVDRVLSRAIERAAEFGFRTETHEGYAVSVLWGEGEEEIGLVSHLDVVPAGENWEFSPFEPFEKNGFVIGRGASDNKGPALVDLYLLRALRDLGISFDHRIRIIYGGAEETGMADIKWYTGNAPVPKLSIITDGGFPVNYAQKGGLDARLFIPAGPVLSNFNAGVARNAVPATARVVLPGATFSAVEDAVGGIAGELRAVISVRQDGEAVEVLARGRSGHSAFPEGTQNAVPLLLRALLAAGLLEGQDRTAAQSVADILSTPYGDGSGIAREDEVSGKLTQNGGIVRPHTGGLELQLDIRYPVTTDHNDLLDVLKVTAEKAGGSLIGFENAPAFHRDRTSPLVDLLQDTFDTVTGSTTEPFAMGGGTHARILPNSITFGPGFGRVPGSLVNGEKPKRPDFLREGHGSAHGPDEFVALENLFAALRVYAVTLFRLDKWLPRA